MLDPVAIGHRIAAREVISLDNLGWIRGPVAKMVVAAGVGIVGGFGTIAVHAATSPSPSVSPDVSPSTNASPSTSTSPSTGASPTTPSPGSGSGNMNCPNM